MSWLPEDLSGSTLIDAGCGTGTLAIEAARRGAEVVAVDLSPTLVNLARERLRDSGEDLDVTFLVGDMRDMDLGCFDYAVAMDSLIHYDVGWCELEAMAMINQKIFFTLQDAAVGAHARHGSIVSRADRALSIEPVAGPSLAASGRAG